MKQDFKLDELLNNLLTDLPEFAESAGDDLRVFLKGGLAGLMQDMDLVHQEDFDNLKQMLLRAEQRVEQLEEALDKMEAN